MTEELRGAIDRFEEELAVIVFDDDQRLNVPRDQLPKGAKAGDAVVARLGAGALRGAWGKSGAIQFADGQSLKWPGERGEGEATLTIEIDAEDTAARRQRVKSLLADIFKDKPRSE